MQFYCIDDLEALSMFSYHSTVNLSARSQKEFAWLPTQYLSLCLSLSASSDEEGHAHTQ